MSTAELIELNACGVLLDIEGTTSSISFVHEVMFPFVLERLEAFVDRNAEQHQVIEACEQIARDAGQVSLSQWLQAANQSLDSDHSAASSAEKSSVRSAASLVIAEVQRLMEADVKATGLKALQGLIWADGFHEGKLRSHVYPDVIPQIKRWRASGLDVRIYSSGSIAAQKLFFGHVDGLGDCLDLFSGHYDTTIGSKKESVSYQRIANDWGLKPAEIVFVSDIAGELSAATAAGVQAVASLRPGNAPLPSELAVPKIDSFAKLVVRNT